VCCLLARANRTPARNSDEKVTFTSSKATVSYKTQKADGTLNPAIVICYDAGIQVDCT